MNIQVVNAIALALLHFTRSESDKDEIIEFLIKLNNIVDNKIVFISTMFFYKVVHISEANLQSIEFDPKVLWTGCLLTACKHHSKRNYQLEDWEIASGVSVREMCVITHQLHALLGHSIILQEFEIEEFIRVFTKMSLEAVQ